MPTCASLALGLSSFLPSIAAAQLPPSVRTRSRPASPRQPAPGLLRVERREGRTGGQPSLEYLSTREVAATQRKVGGDSGGARPARLGPG